MNGMHFFFWKNKKKHLQFITLPQSIFYLIFSYTSLWYKISFGYVVFVVLQIGIHAGYKFSTNCSNMNYIAAIVPTKILLYVCSLLLLLLLPLLPLSLLPLLLMLMPLLLFLQFNSFFLATKVALLPFKCIVYLLLHLFTCCRHWLYLRCPNNKQRITTTFTLPTAIVCPAHSLVYIYVLVCDG